jgi:hypothetical protein
MTDDEKRPGSPVVRCAGAEARRMARFRGTSNPERRKWRAANSSTRQSLVPSFQIDERGSGPHRSPGFYVQDAQGVLRLALSAIAPSLSISW